MGVEARKILKEDCLWSWNRADCAGLVGKALLKLSKCRHDLACEILTFLGTDGILHTPLKKLTESDALMLTPNRAPKSGGLFAKIALSDFCVALPEVGSKT